MSKLTQLHEVILTAFSTKGYSEQSPISRKQLIKVITILIKQKNTHYSQQPFDQAILNEIWKQTQNRLKQSQLQRQSSSIVVEDVIQSFVDAIQILSNRITECSNTVEEMIKRRKQLQKQKDYERAEILHHKMVTLKTDLNQFQKDLIALTYPFNQNINELKKKLSIRKNSVQKSPVVSKKSLEIDIPLLQLQARSSSLNKIATGKQLQEYLKDNNVEYLQFETVDDAKSITLWILGLLLSLQCTVIMVKYSFVNLMTFLLGFFILLEPQQFKPGMTKISLYSCVFSLLMDAIWLLVNSVDYLNPSINSGLTLFNKRYQLYVWFLTVVQVFVKVIYLVLLRRYEFLEIAFSQQMLKYQLQHPQSDQQSYQSKSRQIVDDYIPDMKEFLKIQKPLSSKA